MLNDKRIRIISGHYGSGKTEFSINYAIKLAEMKKNVAIVDLDVVNLYFRSREKEDFLKEKGIRVIGSSIRAASLDVPSISSQASITFHDESLETIIDLGGNPEGARALARYNEYLREGYYDMFFVLNANRPETRSLDDVMKFIVKIQDVVRGKFTGIVNNTHMLKATSVDDILKGYDLAKKASDLTGIPIKYNAGLESVLNKIQSKLEGEMFPINLYMREEWMV
ncbi:MinD/ParA family protein [Tissierella creatinini]|nr:MinD/ParA family protein [Tissierella creatinini]TJX66050.1 MinD/ParA family protein [Soehngenia saccharolytica]